MKKLFFILFFAVVAFNVQAQRLQVTVDYTQGIYNGYTYEKILMAESDFTKDQPRYEGKFAEALAKTYYDVIFIGENAEDADVRVTILQVGKKGDLKADVEYNGQTFRLTGKGGTFGTWLNLFGDGMKSLGENLGANLNKLAKQTM